MARRFVLQSLALVAIVALVLLAFVDFAKRPEKPDEGAGRSEPRASAPRAGDGAEDEAASASRRAAASEAAIPKNPNPASPAPSAAALVLHVRWRDDGTRAAGQTIFLDLHPNDPLADPVELTSGTDGDCRYESLAPGRVVVSTRETGGARSSALLEAGKTTEATIHLDRGFRVRGKVVDSLGAGVRDAEVWLAARDAMARAGGADPHDARPGGYLAARTNESGDFALDRAGGMLGITAWKDGYGFAGSDSRDLWVLSQAQKLAQRPNAPLREDPKKGEPLGEVEVRLVLSDRPAEIAGRVVDGNGLPVAGAAVRCACVFAAGTFEGRWRPDFLPTYARTDSAGRFRARGLVGMECQLWVKSDASVRAAKAIALEAARPIEVEIRLERGVALEGAVRDPDGKPKEGARVSIETEYAASALDMAWNLPNVATDGEGRYRIVGIPAGTFKVSAWHPHAEGDLIARAELSGEPGQTIPWNPTLTLERRKAR